MKRRTKAQLDLDCVVALSASDERAFRFRRKDGGVVMEGVWEPVQPDGNSRSPAATIAVLQPARMVCRTIELPDAPEDKLEIALQLQAETKQMGSIQAWRSASSVLAFRSEDGGRTGVVVDWPANDPGPSLSRELPPDGEPLFAGDSAILAAVMDGYAAGPLVSVAQDRSAFSFALRTAKGLTVRSTRIDPSQWPHAATLSVLESALRGGMSAEQTEELVALLDEAIHAAGDGGFGCTEKDRDALSAHVAGLEDVNAWREHGLKALAALMWFSHAKPLVSLRAQPLGERPGHVGEWINHLGEPRSLLRAGLVVALVFVLAPPLFAGGRLLLLQWKIGDLQGKELSLRAHEKKLDLYSYLSRHAWPMGKLLGDISNATPQGVEWEDLTISQDRNIAIRGLAKTQDDQSGTEVILTFEKQMRDSKVFDKVTKRWDPPDSKGVLKFALAATVVKPLLRPNFKESQDFARKTLAERKYPAVTTSNAPHSATAGESGETHAVPNDLPSIEPLNEAPQPATDSAPGKPQEPSVTPPQGAVVQQAPQPEPSEDSADLVAQRRSRGSRTTTAATNDLPKRSERTPDSANVSTPIPEPLSDMELSAMTKDELQTAMGKVAIARQSAEVDDQTKKRLKEEFDKIKNALKGKK